MPDTTKKRKENEMEHNNVAFSGKSSSQKRSATIKSAEGSRSMAMFLDDICKVEQETGTSRSEALVEAIRHSSLLINAMLRCHERFVRIVASELTVTTITKPDTEENATAVHRMGENHVQIALKELGMEDIYSEMKLCRTFGSDANLADAAGLSNKRRRKCDHRVKQWTEEEFCEQERLLASSKEKLLRGGG